MKTTTSRKDDPKYLDTGRTNTRARDAALVKVIPPKSTVFERSVLYKGAIVWNNLEVGSRSIVNKTMFKAHQKSWLKGSVTLSWMLIDYLIQQGIKVDIVLYKL